MIDPIILLQELIRCKSVTPDEGGAITLLEKLLTKHGFECHRLNFSDKDTPDVENLYAKWGKKWGKNAPNLCFAGHTDVVPAKDEKNWTCDPFGGEIKDGYIWGRGTADMKGGVAAFVAAALNFIEKNGKDYPGSISLLITGDEEGPAINGTKKVLKWMDKHGEKIDFCIVGEPTSKETLGDMVKIGRRGSFNGKITVEGVQGHVAWMQLINLMKTIDALELDKGTERFEPSNLEVINVGGKSTVTNVIPAEVHATFAMLHNDPSSEKNLRDALDAAGIPYDMTLLTEKNNLSPTARISVEGVQGHVALHRLADNPIPKLLTLLKILDSLNLDGGKPTAYEITDVTIDNAADDPVPAMLSSMFNIRFNDQHSSTSIEKKLRDAMGVLQIPYQMTVQVSGESFYTPPGIYSDMLQKSIQKITGLKPKLSTTGGISDARFINGHCLVIEL